MSERVLQQPRDQRRLQPELFRVRNVLPGAAAASHSGGISRTEMRAVGCDAMRGWIENVHERRRSGRGIAVTAVEGYADTFAWKRVGDGDRAPPGAGNAVAGLVKVSDGDIE